MAFFRTFIALSALSLLLSLGACAPKEERYTVYTVVAEMDEALVLALTVGEALTDACGKEAAGEVLAITREGALAEDAHGVYEKAGRVRVKLAVGVLGRREADSIRAGSLRLRAGERLYLLGKTRIEGLCVRVRAI